MVKKARVIQLSYDVVSPWSYLAFLVLRRYQTIWDYELVLNPTWLGGVMVGAKNQSPVMIPNKQKKMQEELPMMANFFGVTCIVPENFPFNTLHIMRFLRVVKMKDPSQLENITLKFFEAIFEKKVQVESLDLIYDTITPEPYSKETLEEYLEISKSNEMKQVVREDVQKLVEQGAFGFPWIDAWDSNGNHLSIFGSDRFEFLAHWLGEEWRGPNPHLRRPRSHL